MEAGGKEEAGAEIPGRHKLVLENKSEVGRGIEIREGHI